MVLSTGKKKKHLKQTQVAKSRNQSQEIPEIGQLCQNQPQEWIQSKSHLPKKYNS